MIKNNHVLKIKKDLYLLHDVKNIIKLKLEQN